MVPVSRSLARGLGDRSLSGEGLKLVSCKLLEGKYACTRTADRSLTANQAAHTV
jgi:hypothetical protein